MSDQTINLMRHLSQLYRKLPRGHGVEHKEYWGSEFTDLVQAVAHDRYLRHEYHRGSGLAELVTRLQRLDDAVALYEADAAERAEKKLKMAF